MKDEELRKQMLDYRAKHNISQSELAKLCNLSQQTVCNVEHGTQTPSMLTRHKILRIIEKEN